MSRFFDELKRRNVFRVAVAYVIASWLILQVADIVLQGIEAPAWVMKVFMLVLALGLPFVPGLEGGGVVEDVGEDVVGFAPGDRVAWADQLDSYAAEVVIAADRLDITEELARLRSHVDQFRTTLAEAGPGSPVGRRLDFLLQELGRETNTVGSKANDADISSRLGSSCWNPA